MNFEIKILGLAGEGSMEGKGFYFLAAPLSCKNQDSIIGSGSDGSVSVLVDCRTELKRMSLIT